MKHKIQKYGTFAGILMVLFFFDVKLDAQLSPGDLSEPHAHLTGLSNCTRCHELGKKVSDSKCLDCHQDIRIRIDEKRGYHASVDVMGKGCVECHSDHHGKKFQMIRFDSERFDHSLTGYVLEGAHIDQPCRNCHKSDFISDQQIREKSATYLGLDQKCLTCHNDPHQGTLSSNCSSCHDFLTFKPASSFDHSKARFTLRGKHAEVDCLLCHKKSVVNGKEMQKFAGLSFGKCTDCHRDIHDNKFGQTCTKCHSEVSFHQIKGMNTFNHSLTSYPLEGRHKTVACASCHKTGYTKDIRHGRCLDCHSDYHKKQFVTKNRTPDCSECHSLQGFEQSTFTIEMHNQSSFKLTGAHLATPCFSCHKKNDKWSFREIGVTCDNCHENIHESVLDNKYDPEPRCVNCHSNNKWSEISFDHSKTGYTLEGAHLRQTCNLCHFKPGEQDVPVQRFSQLTAGCTECHSDPHQNQFDTASEKSCLRCHDYFDWKAGMFNHSNTAFPLDGKHKDVACSKCHPQVVTQQLKYTQYKLKSITCESCHSSLPS